MQQLLKILADLNVKIGVKQGQLVVNAPAGVLTQELRSAIRDNRQALIDALGRASVDFDNEKYPELVIDKECRYESFPLSEVQYAYWIGRNVDIELGHVGTHFYFELECAGLDLDRLNHTFNQIIAYHDMLRALVDSNGRQRILSSVPDYIIKRYDYSQAGEADRESGLRMLRDGMSQQVLRSDRWPLFDIRAARIDAHRLRLFCSWDCLVVDAWSLSIIYRQWYNLYNNDDFCLPELEISFRDYVLAEEKIKKTPGYRKAHKYWWERIDTLPPAPMLPVSGKISKERKHAFTRRRLRLEREKWQALKAYGHRLHLTPSGVLLAAFAEILAYWSKTKHFCLNLTLFNRLPLHEQVNLLAGDFTALTVLEVDTTKGKTFGDRAVNIQQQFFQDLENRLVNGVEVLRELAKRKNYNQKAIMPIVFTSTLMVGSANNNDMGVLESFGPMGYGVSQTPQVLLDYQIFENKGDLVFNWDAVEELFLPGVLEDMFSSHCELLHKLAQSPAAWNESRVCSLPPQQAALRSATNNTEAYQSEELLHTLFIKQALGNPDAVAIKCREGEFSYSEVLSHSKFIADELLKYEVRPNQLVAVIMAKGWEQIVAVLAVHIAGAAYLPIDPDLPDFRREQLLSHGRAKVILTQPGLMDKLSWPNSAACIAIERLERFLPLAQTPVVRQNIADLAYVIFTSGSTGTPKGVMIDHRGAVNTLVHINRLFNVCENDSVLAISSLSFDLSVYDIFGLLACGGCIVLPEARAVKDPARWLELILLHNVSIWNSTPPLMNMLVDYVESLPETRLNSLRLTLLSGDWIPTRLPDHIRTLAGNTRIISLGGATEGSIWSIYYPVNKVDSHWESIPYGKPLPNQHMYVLDKNYQPCPNGVVGDIYIGGIGVALGYWQDEEKTQAHFISHPETFERLYCTGDLGRYLSDGNIEFLGREDSQVKLHGYRVELGEISANILMHEDVADASVQLAKNTERDTLIAYVVPENRPDNGLYTLESADASNAQAEWNGIMEAGKCKGIRYCDRNQADLELFASFWCAMENLCKVTMLDTLEKMECFSDSKEGVNLADRIAQADLEHHRSLIYQWIELLANEGLINRNGEEITAVSKPEKDFLQRGLVKLADYAELNDGIQGFKEYIESCLINQTDLLNGTKTPLELLFPGGSWRLAESLYQENPIAHYHNAVIAEVVRYIVGSFAGERVLRILEVGAGTGATTSVLLDMLPAARTEYWYTDLSNFFLTGAQKKFSQYSFIKYGIYNIDLDPKEQGYPPHSFDMVLAVNVLHDAKNIGSSLNKLRSLLRPGAYLLALEGTANTPWQMVTVGYLEGFGGYEDERLATRLPLLDEKRWMQAFEVAGYERFSSFPLSDNENRHLLTAMQQHLLVARGPWAVKSFNPRCLDDYLRARLPDYMVPHQYYVLDSIPLSSNGKVDVKALPLPQQVRASGTRTIVAPASDVEETILNIWREVLNIEQLSINDNFFEVGGDSLLMTQVLGKINSAIAHPVTMADLFAYPSIQALTAFINADENAEGPFIRAGEGKPDALKRESADIAIIGMAGRFPDADDVEQFWRNIQNGKCSVRHYSDQELLLSGVSADLIERENYVKAGVKLDNFDLFDANYFAITPREAQIMDPQQRILLECSVSALENAGYANEKYGGKIGVFVGKDTSRYLHQNIMSNPDILETVGRLGVMNVNEKDYAATYISYKLNLTGPSVNINTACSTSLVAVHHACKSLRDGECRIALSGGVSVDTSQPAGHIHKEGFIASADGYCRAFSEDASGTIGGSGVGLVVLKKLDAALEDGDSIHAVIKGSAINNDGSSKVSYSAPSVLGQAAVVQAALEASKVSPDSIEYIECHGTGTRLGDPIEVAALNKVFGQSALRKNSCALGSVKTNIGHLDAAAGAASLIKTVQALKHRQIPPSLNFSRPNSRIDFEKGPFYVNTALKEWQATSLPRRAGVSSFGVGGTNAHVIVEEPPARAVHTIAPKHQLLILSAKSEKSLLEMRNQLAAYLETSDDISIADVAFTLQLGRSFHKYRTCFSGATAEDLANSLRRPGSDRVAAVDESKTLPLVFLFPGQSVQQLSLSYKLYQSEKVFRDAFDHCAELLADLIDIDIRLLLYPAWKDDYPALYKSDSEGGLDVNQTAVMQPLLFSLEYSLATLLLSVGIRPAAMMGHSLGEYVAACLSEVFSLAEALSLVAARGHLIQSLEAGSMLAVSLRQEEAGSLASNFGCDLAAINSSTQCVVSGSRTNIAELMSELRSRRIEFHVLQTSHAFHSSMVEPILDIFADCLREVKFSPPKIPFISNLSGTWIQAEEVCTPAYWVKHLRHTVLFSEGVTKLFERDKYLFIEVGPGHALSALVRNHGADMSKVLPIFGYGKQVDDDYRRWLNTLGEIWQQGAEIDWAALHNGDNAGRIPLPTYVFDRRSYWIKRGNCTSAPGFGANATSTEAIFSIEQPRLSPNQVGPTEPEAAENISEMEKKLTGIWKQYLGISDIGVDDDFFSLGGDSLLMTQIIDNIKKVFEVSIPMERMFDLSTIKKVYLYILSVRSEKIDDLSEAELDSLLDLIKK